MSNAYILLGESIAELVDTALEAVGLREDKQAFLLKHTENGRRIFERWAIGAAFDYLGIPFDPDDPINAYTVTQAINRGLLDGSGFEFTNVFNAETTKKDLELFALDKINESGQVYLRSLKRAELKRAARAVLAKKLNEQIAEGSGALLDAMPDDAKILRQIESSKRNEGRELLDTDKAIKNRERQANYRQSHGRSWRAK